MNLSKIEKAVEIWKQGPKSVVPGKYHDWYNRLSCSFIKSMWKCEYATLLKYILHDPLEPENLTADELLKKKAPEWEATGKYVEAHVFFGEDKAKEVAEEYRNNFFNQTNMYKKKDGALYDTGVRNPNATYIQAVRCAEAVLRQPEFMKYLTHEHTLFHQVLEFDIAGVPFKAELDVLNLTLCFELDFKTSADLERTEWNAVAQKRVGFIKQQEYGTQRAIYRHAIWQIYEVDVLPMIGAVSKEKFPDANIYEFRDKEALDALMEGVENCLPEVLSILNGERLPVMCNSCDYCKRDRVIKKVKVVPIEEY